MKKGKFLFLFAQLMEDGRLGNPGRRVHKHVEQEVNPEPGAARTLLLKTVDLPALGTQQKHKTVNSTSVQVCIHDPKHSDTYRLKSRMYHFPKLGLKGTILLPAEITWNPFTVVK